MGAWDYGPFDNDGALDFAGDLADRPGDASERLRAAMTAVTGSHDYLDRDDVSAAVAAACLVAGRLDPAVMTDPNGGRYLGKLSFDAEPLRDLAAQVFARSFTAGDNEWFALWDEGGSMPAVEEAHAPYRRALTR
ncbi:DUF4259 domain-containing protein [Spirillospora sp. NPDC050679]